MSAPSQPTESQRISFTDEVSYQSGLQSSKQGSEYGYPSNLARRLSPHQLSPGLRLRGRGSAGAQLGRVRSCRGAGFSDSLVLPASPRVDAAGPAGNSHSGGGKTGENRRPVPGFAQPTGGTSADPTAPGSDRDTFAGRSHFTILRTADRLPPDGNQERLGNRSIHAGGL